MQTTTSRSNVVSGVAGGLVVVVFGLILLAAGVLHTGENKTVVTSGGSQAAGNTGNDVGSRGRGLHMAESLLVATA